MTQLSNARVLITGAASGIGWLMAQRLADLGAQVALWDINKAGLKQCQEALVAKGHQSKIYYCDLSEPDSIRQAIARTQQDFDGIDVLINNAGIVSGKNIEDLSDEDIERTFAVNTLSLFRLTRAWLPGMRERGHGHIVTIASAGGISGTAKLVDYCASKFAAVGFDESLRTELKRRGSKIQTTVVCPFYINTGMFSGVKTRFPWLLPILEPEDVVSKIIQALQKNKRRVVLPWFVYTAWMTKALPVSIYDALMHFFGISKSMDEFTGRDKNKTL